MTFIINWRDQLISLLWVTFNPGQKGYWPRLKPFSLSPYCLIVVSPSWSPFHSACSVSTSRSASSRDIICKSTVNLSSYPVCLSKVSKLLRDTLGGGGEKERERERELVFYLQWFSIYGAEWWISCPKWPNHGWIIILIILCMLYIIIC